MNSEELFEALDKLLIEGEESFLVKIRSLGIFDKDQFDSILKLIRTIPSTADKDDCLKIKRGHFDSLLYLMPALINGANFLAEPEFRKQAQHGIGQLSGAFTSAFYDEPPEKKQI